MRLATLQVIWQHCAVARSHARLSVPSHSSIRVSALSVNYVIFVIAINEAVFLVVRHAK